MKAAQQVARERCRPAKVQRGQALRRMPAGSSKPPARWPASRRAPVAAQLPRQVPPCSWPARWPFARREDWAGAIGCGRSDFLRGWREPARAHRGHRDRPPPVNAEPPPRHLRARCKQSAPHSASAGQSTSGATRPQFRVRAVRMGTVAASSGFASRPYSVGFRHATSHSRDEKIAHPAHAPKSFARSLIPGDIIKGWVSPARCGAASHP